MKFLAYWTWRGNKNDAITTVSSNPDGNFGIDLTHDGDDNTYWHSKLTTGVFINSRQKVSLLSIIMLKNFSKAPWFHVSFPVARQVCFIRVRRRQDCCSDRYKDMIVGIYKNGELVRDWLTKTADGGPLNEWEG